MTTVNTNEVFEKCEFPFYKEVSVKDKEFTCALYSISTPYVSHISVPLINFDAAVHKLSLEIIRLKGYELKQPAS